MLEPAIEMFADAASAQRFAGWNHGGSTEIMKVIIAPSL
jgi:hypothetical protein